MGVCARALGQQARSAAFSRGAREICPRHVIMVVHHEAAARNRVALAMGVEGSLVLCAADGREALEISRGRKGKIDLVITEVTVPDLGASDLCSRLLEERPGIRILVMSGIPVLDPSAQGASWLPMPAPFDGQRLGERVRAILGAPRESRPYVYVAFFGEAPCDQNFTSRPRPACALHDAPPTL